MNNESDKENVTNNSQEIINDPSSANQEEVKETSQSSSQDIKTSNNPTKPKKSKTKIIIVILILCIIIALAILLFIFLPKKDSSETKKIKTDTKEVQSDYKMTGNSLQDFDLSFLTLEKNDTNIIYSPLSIKYALAMLSAGSDGLSKAQIDAVIGDYHANKYTQSQNMSFANAMFIRNTYEQKIKDSYEDTISDKYNAELITDPFDSPANINSWVSNNTFNLINNLVDDVSETDFMLINALAIDMEWVKRIQPAEGKDKPFSAAYKHENFNIYVSSVENDQYSTLRFDNKIDAKAVELVAAVNNYDIVEELGEDNIRNTISSEYTKWLNEGGCGDDLPVDEYVNQYIKEIDSNYQRVDSSTDFLVYDDEKVKVFAKDLKEYNGTTLQYVGIMPKTESLSSFIHNNDAKSLNNILSNLKILRANNFTKGKVTKIEGSIPLFNFDYTLQLMDDLKELGITDVFSKSKADLSKLTSEKNAFINQATHKANIEFSNDGIKAAAATAFGGYGAASCGFTYNYEVPVETIDITFNKPYLFLIRDKNTKETWFVGKVTTPTAN